MNEQTRTEVEAAAFRRLVDHLREHTEVQNIDLMKPRRVLPQLPLQVVPRRRGGSGHGDELRGRARDHIYAMPYSEWKSRHQQEATPAQQAAYDANHPKHG